MSTVIFDNDEKTLTADRKAYGGSYAVSPGTKSKLHRLKDGSIVGITSGVVGLPERFVRFLNGDGDNDPLIEGSFNALRCTQDGELFYYDDSTSASGPVYPDNGGMVAIGTGAKYAYAAMWCGASPARAIRCASEFDPHTGDSTDELRLVEPAVYDKDDLPF